MGNGACAETSLAVAIRKEFSLFIAGRAIRCGRLTNLKFMGDLIDTTEMYLKTVYELLEEGIPALRARIVDRLGQSGPTVSETVARLERDGLLHVGDNREIALTDLGMRRASNVMRRHRLAERLLVDVIKLDVAAVHNEACKWEHVISDSVAQRINELLDSPDCDPFGNPIPADEDVPRIDTAPARGLMTLAAAMASSQHVRIMRIAESLQVDELAVADVIGAGLLPGEVVTTTDQPGVLERRDGSLVEVARYDAERIFVSLI